MVRGLTPSTAADGGSLNTVNVTDAVRSPSANRLGSLFNSINRSVTSAFSNFVAVNQPVPGVIQHYDQSPTPALFQRQQSQPRFAAPPRRDSSHQETTTHTVVSSAPRTSSPAAEMSMKEMWNSQQPRVPANEEPGGRVVQSDEWSMTLPRAPAARRPRGGLPLHCTSDPAPPYAKEPSTHNFSWRGTSVHCNAVIPKRKLRFPALQISWVSYWVTD